MTNSPFLKLALKSLIVYLCSIPLVLWLIMGGIYFAIMMSLVVGIYAIVTLARPNILDDLYSRSRRSDIPEELNAAFRKINIVWSILFIILVFIWPTTNIFERSILSCGPPFTALFIYDIYRIFFSKKSPDIKVTKRIVLRLSIPTIFALSIIGLYHYRNINGDESHKAITLISVFFAISIVNLFINWRALKKSTA